jgi:hypothetical protein
MRFQRLLGDATARGHDTIVEEYMRWGIGAEDFRWLDPSLCKITLRIVVRQLRAGGDVRTLFDRCADVFEAQCDRDEGSHRDLIRLGIERHMSASEPEICALACMMSGLDCLRPHLSSDSVACLLVALERDEPEVSLAAAARLQFEDRFGPAQAANFRYWLGLLMTRYEPAAMEALGVAADDLRHVTDKARLTAQSLAMEAFLCSLRLIARG